MIPTGAIIDLPLPSPFKSRLKFIAILHAAIIHDALYRKDFLDHISRANADLIFRDLMWNTEVPFWKIPPFYAAVRSFGWRSYKKVSEISIHPKAIPIPE